MAEKRRSAEPSLEYRMVFVQYVRRQKARYNPSLSHFVRLPDVIQREVLERWHTRHPRMSLPDLELSDRPPKRRHK